MRLTQKEKEQQQQENDLAINQANGAISKVYEAINTIDYVIPYIQDKAKVEHLRTISRELGQVLYRGENL